MLPPEEPAEQPPVEQPQPEPVEPVAARAKRTRKKGNGEDEGVAEPALNTIDAVGAAFNVYRETFGIDAAMEDGPKILASIFGNGVVQIKAIPVDDPAKLAETVARVRRAINSNEFGRQAVHEVAP